MKPNTVKENEPEAKEDKFKAKKEVEPKLLEPELDQGEKQREGKQEDDDDQGVVQVSKKRCGASGLGCYDREEGNQEDEGNGTPKETKRSKL